MAKLRGFDVKMMTDIERIGQGATSPAESLRFRLVLFKFHSPRRLRSRLRHRSGLNNIKIFYVAVGKARRGRRRWNEGRLALPRAGPFPNFTQMVTLTRRPRLSLTSAKT